MADSNRAVRRREQGGASAVRRPHFDLTIVAFAAAIFLGCIVSPPHLMDDVDAVQAQIARNMLESGDWVTARLDGVAYLEKSPLIYWIMAASFRIFGVQDWAARLPLALVVMCLCWLTARFGRWAFGDEAGIYSGLVLCTCVGLFLFTRILIPDAAITLTITLAMWAFLRALDDDEPHPRLWAAALAASLGTGLLLKGLISIVFPVGTGVIYLLAVGQFFSIATWKKLRPLTGLLILLAIAAPWHIVATLRNPPYLDFAMHSGPGEYRGFLWFYFINEHVLRFLNLRYPRDYNTVPRLWFWLLHLVWLFPASVYFPALLRLNYRPTDRAGRTRMLALCWMGFVMVFFTFSTTQEYYSMPIYPALALLLGSAIAVRNRLVGSGTRVLSAISAVAVVAIGTILVVVRGVPTTGEFSSALAQHPELYTLSLGHVGDLTLRSFAYLRLPLVIAGAAFLIGATGCWLWRNNAGRAFFAVAVMMVVLFHAARLAMVTFDSYLGSKPLTDVLLNAPPGDLIEANAYYAFSSVFFYTNKRALLLNGRMNNLEYGSYAPDAPKVFIGDAEFQRLWSGRGRYYLLAYGEELTRLEKVVGRPSLHVIKESGGNYLVSNQELSQ